ncbi:MAG: biotin/lipoyl-binding protein [Burkholderiales bacterium]|nr:biotin/lipoyl-binding protein [Burkholderiales bacterium]
MVGTLPILRQELTLSRGADSETGAPSWTLHDPVANRFYQLSWPAFEILSRWYLDSMDAICEAVAAETTLRITAADFEALLRFLYSHHLIVARSAADTAQLSHRRTAGKLSKAQWLLKHYLFIRIPLVQPMRFLNWGQRYVQWAFEPWFWACIVGIGLLGLYLVSRQWETFTHTFSTWHGLSGVLGIGLALSLAKVIHELGHAFTARRFGCRVPTMGVALLVMWPVLYTDTNEVWKLASRTQRLKVGAAGILAELALAACATLLWNFLSPGPLQAGVFMLATTTWIATLAVNASPFMRFDGYFLLADWLDMPNLHDRAFALGRWWLREQLFDLGEPAPESFAPPRRRFLIAFAFVTWLYRLTLFMSIALVVYHAFFKALGTILLCVELGWFIILPLWRELHAWWQRRQQLRWCPATYRSATLLALVLAILMLPWQSAVRAPAVIESAQAQGLYASDAGWIDAAQPLPKQGQAVKAGEALLTLHSPDLQYQLARAEAELQYRARKAAQQPFDQQLATSGPTIQKQLEAAQEAVNGLHRQIDQLTLRAPFDGHVTDLSPWLAAHAWVAHGERLFDVVGGNTAQATAWVDEVGVRNLAATDAVLVSDNPELPALHCRLAGVDAVNAATIDQPYVASLFGGSLPTERRGNEIVPVTATWRVRLAPCSAPTQIHQEMRAVAVLKGERRSIAGSAVRYAMAWLQRESAL